ncbi:hypothetical protein M405DRAFT_806339, partial [Rhizopogon salebrosus TDB-379]
GELDTPLKDWSHNWYQGPNRKLAVINQYQSDAACFLVAYPEAERGHYPLLETVNKARGERVRRNR